MPILQIQNLAKKYPGAENRAVDKFSITVEKGEIIALLGESGCGKTTMLRLIAGFEAADSGEIILHGNVVDGSGKFTEPRKTRDWHSLSGLRLVSSSYSGKKCAVRFV
jgi:iron(III) transport system ATP-binding protein